MVKLFMAILILFMVVIILASLGALLGYLIAWVSLRHEYDRTGPSYPTSR